MLKVWFVLPFFVFIFNVCEEYLFVLCYSTRPPDTRPLFELLQFRNALKETFLISNFFVSKLQCTGIFLIKILFAVKPVLVSVPEPEPIVALFCKEEKNSLIIF